LQLVWVRQLSTSGLGVFSIRKTVKNNVLSLQNRKTEPGNQKSRAFLLAANNKKEGKEKLVACYGLFY
jgi:hypothetical protein